MQILSAPTKNIKTADTTCPLDSLARRQHSQASAHKISPRTVKNHFGNFSAKIYVKTCFAGR